MAAGHVNRTDLEANYQNTGEVYDDTKTEGAFEVIADQLDLNWDDYAVLKAALAAVTAGASGAHYVKSAAIAGVTGGNVYLQLADIYAQLLAAIMGAIPNGTLTDAKLSTAAADILARFAAHEAEYTNMISARNGLNANAIINRNFDIAQRGTSFTVIDGSTSYTLDRWQSRSNSSGANATASQAAISDLDGSKYGLKIIHASAPTNFGRLNSLYTLEAADSYKFAGKEVTFSCKVKAVGGINKVQANARYNTTQVAITPSSTGIKTSSSVSINSSTWTDFTFTFTAPIRATLTTTGVFGIDIVGSNVSAEASGDGYILAQVQLCAGDTALPFQPRSYDEELALCQRYYERIEGTSASIRAQLGVAAALSTTSLLLPITYKAEKRINPTFLQSGTFRFQPGGGAATLAFSEGNKSGCALTATTSGVAANQAWAVQSSDAGGSIAFDSEL